MEEQSRQREIERDGGCRCTRHRERVRHARWGIKMEASRGRWEEGDREDKIHMYHR